MRSQTSLALATRSKTYERTCTVLRRCVKSLIFHSKYAQMKETSIPQLGHGLSKPDLATRTYLLGGIFCLLKEQRTIATSHRSTQHLLADLQIRLEATFSLSPEQRVSNFLVLLSLSDLKSKLYFRQIYELLRVTLSSILTGSHS